MLEYGHVGADYFVHISVICLLAGFAEPISLTLKMEAICSSETSVKTQLTTRGHIPGYDTLQDMLRW
jgi:hypothetical protein